MGIFFMECQAGGCVHEPPPWMLSPVFRPRLTIGSYIYIGLCHSVVAWAVCCITPSGCSSMARGWPRSRVGAMCPPGFFGFSSCQQVHQSVLAVFCDSPFLRLQCFFHLGLRREKQAISVSNSAPQVFHLCHISFLVAVRRRNENHHRSISCLCRIQYRRCWLDGSPGQPSFKW